MDKQPLIRTAQHTVRNSVAGLLCLAGLTGCQSFPTGQPGTDNKSLPPPDHAVVLEEEGRAFARAMALYSEALRHEANREQDKALEAYNQVIQYDPDAAQAYLRKALILIRRDRHEEAIALLQTLVDRQPDAVQPLIWLGSAYRQDNRSEEALAVYRQALAVAPDKTALYVQVVDLLIQQGDEEEAIELLQEGIQAVETPVALYRVLGELYMRRGILEGDTSAGADYLDAAIDTLEEARMLAPEDTAILRTLGDLYLREGAVEQAVALFEDIARLDATDLAVRERLAQLYEVDGRLEKATAVLEEMILLQPANARLYFALGTLYERLEDREKALLNYRLAARVGRPDPAAYLKLAVLQMEDDPDAAAEALREGLELLPGDPALLEMLGYVRFNQEAYGDAIEAFRDAERELLLADGHVDSATPDFYLYLALSYYFDGQPDMVPETLSKAMDTHEAALETFSHFVFLDQEEGRIDTAIDIFEELRAEHPEHPTLLTLLAFLYSFDEAYPQALETFALVEDLVGGTEQEAELLSGRFYFWYAAAHERVGQYDQADQLFHQSIEIDPDNPEAYNYLAYMWAEKGVNLDQAKDYVLKALAEHPDSAAFIDTLGWIYYQQGRFLEAYKEVKRAAEIIPDDPVILEHLGDIYLALEKPDKALRTWQTALSLAPENEDVAQKIVEHGPVSDAIEDQVPDNREDADAADTPSSTPLLKPDQADLPTIDPSDTSLEPSPTPDRDYAEDTELEPTTP